MAGEFSFTFDKRRLEELQRMLGEMSEVDKRQAITASLRRTTRNMVQGGKRNLASRNTTNRPKKKGGHLIKSFKTSSSKKKVVAYAGFSRSGANKGNHAHLIDRGTAKRWTKKGYYRGSVSKKAPYTGSMFWTDSVNAQGNKGLQNLSNVIYQELVKITRRRK